MPKMTKTQAKRSYVAIVQKAGRLWNLHGRGDSSSRYGMTTQDLVAIEKICDKYLKKF